MKKKMKFITSLLLIIAGVGTLLTLVFDYPKIAEVFGMMYREEETMILVWVKATTAMLGILFLLVSVNPEKHKLLLLLCAIYAVFITFYSAFSWMITGKGYPLIILAEGSLSVLLVASFVLTLSLPTRTRKETEQPRAEINEKE
jgi:hypothetical protein